MDETAGARAREFATLAHHYKELIDNRNANTLPVLLEQAAQVLALLYAAAFNLPSVEGSDELPESRTSDAEWVDLYKSLQSVLGSSNYYREVIDPYNLEEGEPGVGSLADDLADIYRDLVEGLALWSGGSRENAVWAWRFGFREHWGQHATSALRAIYAFVHR